MADLNTILNMAYAAPGIMSALGVLHTGLCMNPGSSTVGGACSPRGNGTANGTCATGSATHYGTCVNPGT